MKRSIIIWAVAIILVAVAVYTTTQYNKAPTPAPVPQASKPSENATGSSAPGGSTQSEVVESVDAIDFTLEDLNGNKVSLSDYKGKEIYLNFWATWCGYCKQELPYIQQLYKDRKGFDLVVLTVDLQEKKPEVAAFLANNKYDFPTLLDTEGDVANLYGVSSIPLSLLIDKNFKIVSAHKGYMSDYNMLKEFVDQLKRQ